MQVTSEQLFTIRQAVAARGVDVQVRTDYSGRGMYGRQCVGFVTEHDSLAVTAVVNAVAEVVTGFEWKRGDVAEDELGLQRITYFPKLTYIQ